jgi:molybdopterin synthase sulfur carrier subunit
MIRLLYFASLREELGCAGEDYPLDGTGIKVSALRTRLAARDSTWNAALGPDRLLLAAINQELASPEALIKSGDEVAFFPPVTGG